MQPGDEPSVYEGHTDVLDTPASQCCRLTSLVAVLMTDALRRTVRARPDDLNRPSLDARQQNVSGQQQSGNERPLAGRRFRSCIRSETGVKGSSAGLSLVEAVLCCLLDVAVEKAGHLLDAVLASEGNSARVSKAGR